MGGTTQKILPINVHSLNFQLRRYSCFSSSLYTFDGRAVLLEYIDLDLILYVACG